MKRTLEPGEEGEEESRTDETDSLRRPPPAETLDWVATSVGGGAELVSVRGLTEGHWHANHVVTLRDASGDDQELVLRRWARPEWKSEDPDFTPDREAAVLEMLGKSSVPTPRLIAVDSDGTACDVPALLTDKLPGHPPGQPQDIDAFIKQLAEALPQIHAVDGDARKRLPAYRRYYNGSFPSTPPPWARDARLWERASAVAADPPPPGRECLIHRDYHPGNTLWEEGLLSGVVDWTQGSWGPAAVDTAHMRWNLAVVHGREAADTFLEHYRRLSSDTEGDQAYWDVVTLLDVVFPELTPDGWPQGWEQRLEQYLESVLRQSARSS